LIFLFGLGTFLLINVFIDMGKKLDLDNKLIENILHEKIFYQLED